MARCSFARSLAPVVVLLAPLVSPTLALAQSSEAALAEALFQDGKRLMALQKYDEACPKFEEALRRVKKLGTLLNLGTCHDKQGKTGSAFGELTEAASLAKDANEPQRVEYARKLLQDLEKRLSKIVIDAPNAPEAAEIRIDGKPIGRASRGTPIPLDPGDHQVEMAAPGYETWSRQVTIPKDPGTLTFEVPALVKLPEEKPPPPQDTPPVTPPPAVVDGAEGGTNTGQLVAGVVIGGVGLVSVGIGAYFGIDTFDKQGESEDHCVDTRCDMTGVTLREDASTSATVSTVTISIGAAAAAGGLIVALTAVDWSAKPEKQSSRIWVAPLLSQRDAGIVVGGSL